MPMPEYQAQYHGQGYTDNDAGHYGEIEGKPTPVDKNIAGKPAQERNAPPKHERQPE